jgi:Putative prokaryotic signal transducing protein
MSLVRLMIVANEVEAETIGGLLRTEGIESVHRFTDVGAGAGDATGSGGPREVLVEDEDLERARELVG